MFLNELRVYSVLQIFLPGGPDFFVFRRLRIESSTYLRFISLGEYVVLDLRELLAQFFDAVDHRALPSETILVIIKDTQGDLHKYSF